MYEYSAPTLEAARLYTDTVLSINPESLTLSQHIRATYDALHAMGLAEQAQREAAKAQLASIKATLAAIDTANSVETFVHSDRSATARELVRADFLDSDLISGMFTERTEGDRRTGMTYDELINSTHDVSPGSDCEVACMNPEHGVAYGEQTWIGVITGDYANMFDLK